VSISKEVKNVPKHQRDLIQLTKTSIYVHIKYPDKARTKWYNQCESLSGVGTIQP